MAEHTPGPWKRGPFEDWEAGCDASGDFQWIAIGGPEREPPVALVVDNYPGDAIIANADLIAAAPKLLSELKRTVDRFEKCIVASGSDPEFAAEAVKDARAIIAEATGAA